MKKHIAIKSLFRSINRKKTKRKSPGHVPGHAIFTGEQKLETVKITQHVITNDSYSKIEIENISELVNCDIPDVKQWIEVRGVHDVEVLEKLWDHFDVHPLMREDIVSISQRPKIEHYKDMIFIVLRMLSGKSDTEMSFGLEMEQVSIVLGRNVVISFQESNNGIFEPIYKRLENASTRLRKLGHDYLTYALMDTIVDHYFGVIDAINDAIEAVEIHVMNHPKPEFLHEIHGLRRDLIYFRKSVWSLRDGINSLIRDDSELISSEIKIYLRDVYDHVVQVIDSVENNREMVFSLFDMYMSTITNRLNEVTKVLTIIATIFIPLTFIVGIYGMNFNPDASPFNMPELDWYYGYPVILGVMSCVVIGMLLFFKKKGWI